MAPTTLLYTLGSGRRSLSNPNNRVLEGHGKKVGFAPNICTFGKKICNVLGLAKVQPIRGFMSLNTQKEAEGLEILKWELLLQLENQQVNY